LRAYAESGLTRRDFCTQHGVALSTLGAWLRKAPGVKQAGAQGRARHAWGPDEKRRMVEAFQKSGLSQLRFARTFGINPRNLQRWLGAWRRDGPQGLEGRKPGRPKGTGTGSKLPSAVQAQIVRTQRRFPDFGVRKLTQWLARFRGVQASTGSVGRVLREQGVPPQPSPKPRRKKPQLPRRFERSRPGELWQSDITSFVLRRHGLRVYLTVYLDDFSRYVVGWALEAHQRSELVTTPLLEAIGRYGKPKEVLTDQGRQYFAWRGKSEFQKLLARLGIDHVVSRTHHPQTLGKCERLWSTVGCELWERARPEDLSEARERLGHFFAHYNFFRPHQGIDGLVPADRFFKAESALRSTLESQLADDELAVALGDPPRQGVYLFGQIGDRQVSLHGERGKLVVHTPQGSCMEIDSRELGLPGGVPPGEPERDAEVSDAADESDHGPGEPERVGDPGDDGRDAAAEADAALPQAGAGGDAPEPGAGGAGALEAGEPGGASGGAPQGHAGAGDVAGPQDQGGGSQRAVAASAAGVAAQPDGAVGYAGWPSEAAAESAQEGGSLDGDRGEPQPAEAAHRQAGAGEPGPAGGPEPDRDDAQRGGAPVEVEDSDPGGRQSPGQEASDASPRRCVERSGRPCGVGAGSGGVS